MEYEETMDTLRTTRARITELLSVFGLFAVTLGGCQNITNPPVGAAESLFPAQVVEFSMPSGNYDSAIVVELTTSTPDSQIFYTLDGTTPTSEALHYSEPIHIVRGGTTTISAIAFGSGLSQSAPSSVSYSIDHFRGIEYRDLVTVPTGRYVQTSAKVVDPDYVTSFEHTVSTFKIARFEVTYDLWYRVRTRAISLGYDVVSPGREGHDGIDGAEPTGSSKHEPVTMVSFRDSIVWANAYSELSGLKPVYYVDPALMLPLRASTLDETLEVQPGQQDNPFVDWEANGYRLLTEGEWQYAASYQNGLTWTLFDYASGASDSFYNSEATWEVAWCWPITWDQTVPWWHLDSTMPVGLKPANALGLHDMSGNVKEPVWDWYATPPASPQVDYRGPTAGPYRVARGGGFGSPADQVAVGTRLGTWPWGVWEKMGVRLARAL